MYAIDEHKTKCISYGEQARAQAEDVDDITDAMLLRRDDSSSDVDVGKELKELSYRATIHRHRHREYATDLLSGVRVCSAAQRGTTSAAR